MCKKCKVVKVAVNPLTILLSLKFLENEAHFPQVFEKLKDDRVTADGSKSRRNEIPEVTTVADCLKTVG